MLLRKLFVPLVALLERLQLPADVTHQSASDKNESDPEIRVCVRLYVWVSICRTAPERKILDSMTATNSMAEETKETVLPPWQLPKPDKVTYDVGLEIVNSLTRKKEKFITMDGGKHVRWYM